VRVEKVNESKPTDDASKIRRRCQNCGVHVTCGISWERDLQIDPAAAGVKAARTQLRLLCGTREVDRRCEEKRQVVIPRGGISMRLSATEPPVVALKHL